MEMDESKEEQGETKNDDDKSAGEDDDNANHNNEVLMSEDPGADEAKTEEGNKDDDAAPSAGADATTNIKDGSTPGRGDDADTNKEGDVDATPPGEDDTNAGSRPPTRPSQMMRSSVILGNKIIFLDDIDDLHQQQREDDEDDVQISWNIRRTADKPCTCCCQLCGGWIALILLLVILSVTVGSIEFSLGVPFYAREEINQQREDAFRAIERDADFVSTYGQDANAECVHEDPTILTRNGTLVQGPMPTGSCQRASTSFMRLVYISKDRTTNILTEESLKKIEQVEDRILSTLELTRNCYLVDSTYPVFETRNPEDWIATISATAKDEPQFVACERISSVLNFLDPLYFDRETETGLGYYLIPNDQVSQEYNYSSLGDVINYWNQFYVRTYNLTNYDFAVATVGETITLPNLFWEVTSSDFQLGASGAVGLTSTYSLGVPIHSYASASDSSADQHSEIGQWLWDNFDSYLKSVKLDGIDLYWDDSEAGMSTAEEGDLALKSMLFLPASLVAVLLYLIYMQDSLFIGLMGIMQILLSFFPTLIVYRYVVGEDYLGVLNVIALYIILGIGVDNIFVFCDQFHHQRDEKDLSRRMQKTFNVAGRAMFITSCTTFVSFIANATSAFPAVRTFGIFAALLVVMNFLAVIIFFPAVYAVYYTRVHPIWWDHPSLLLLSCCKRMKVPCVDGEKDKGNSDEDELERELSE